MQPTPRIVYTIPVSIEFSLTTIVAKWILHFARSCILTYI
jgi:hypothetical protein